MLVLSKRKTLLMLVIIVGLIVSVVIINYAVTGKEEVLFTGSMYVNDCGEPKGGFEWAGEYNITITNKRMYVIFHSCLLYTSPSPRDRG